MGEKLQDILSDSTLQQKVFLSSLSRFWITLFKGYPERVRGTSSKNYYQLQSLTCTDQSLHKTVQLKKVQNKLDAEADVQAITINPDSKF